MADIKRGFRICVQCGKEIVYDRERKMWYAVSPNSGYYCPSDPNEELCQHHPEKK